MIDVTLNIKENDMFADVKIFSFNLILSIDFLMKISNFFQTETDKASDVKSVSNKNKQVQAGKFCCRHSIVTVIDLQWK